MIRIIVDSTTDMTPEVRERVTVVPLSIRFGEEEYRDGVSITRQEFYEKLVECDDLPTTSQATPEQFLSIFEETLKAEDEAIVITLSSKLSGTCQSAKIAAEEYGGRVSVIDSETVTIGAGILVSRALEFLDAGLTAKEIVARLEEEKQHIRIVALLDTLEYLKRGGRISKTVAFAGGILAIKPVVSVESGEIKLLGKARGSKQGNNLLAEEIQKSGGVDFTRPLLLGYTGVCTELLETYIADSTALWEGNTESLRYEIIGSTVGTHVGPGAIAVAFFGKE